MSKSRPIMVLVSSLLVVAIGAYRWQTDSSTGMLIVGIAVVGIGYAIVLLVRPPHDAATITEDGLAVVGFGVIPWADIADLDYQQDYVSPTQMSAVDTFLALNLNDDFKARASEHRQQLMRQNEHHYSCDVAIFAIKGTNLDDGYDQIEAKMGMEL